MNRCFFTAQIVTWPRKSISESGREFTKLLIRIPNPKKGQACFYLNASAIYEVGMYFWKWYNKGDYLIFEGYLKITNLQGRKKQLELIIIKEHPICLDI